jgi:hypothetical protein
MTRWIKRVLLGMAALLTAGLILAGVALYYMTSSPAHYRTFAWDETGRMQLNQAAVEQLAEARNLAAAAWSADVSTARGRPTSRPATQLRLTLTEEQLNAFLRHNFAAEQAAAFGPEGGIFLRDGWIILTRHGHDLGLDMLVSICLRPMLNEQGLLLKLDKIMAGRLPLPPALAAAELDHLRQSLRRQIPGWQKAATMDAQGSCNAAFVQAGLGQLLLASLDGRPGEPAVYVPGENGRALPLAVTEIAVGQGELTIGVAVMDTAGGIGPTVQVGGMTGIGSHRGLAYSPTGFLAANSARCRSMTWSSCSSSTSHRLRPNMSSARNPRWANNCPMRTSDESSQRPPSLPRICWCVRDII